MKDVLLSGNQLVKYLISLTLVIINSKTLVPRNNKITSKLTNNLKGSIANSCYFNLAPIVTKGLSLFFPSLVKKNVFNHIIFHHRELNDDIELIFENEVYLLLDSRVDNKVSFIVGVRKIL